MGYWENADGGKGMRLIHFGKLLKHNRKSDYSCWGVSR